MRIIDPRHLLQFHEIIRTGSFTRAATTPLPRHSPKPASAPQDRAAIDARAAATSIRRRITGEEPSTKSSTSYASRASTRRRRPGAPRATHLPEIKRPPPSTPTSTSTMVRRGSPHSARRRLRKAGRRRSAGSHPVHHSSSSSPAKSKSSRRAAEQRTNNTLGRTYLARY